MRRQGVVRLTNLGIIIVMDINYVLSKYNYKFPAELIAQVPAQPRQSAKLLAYNRRLKKISYDTFANIGKYLPKNSVLVFNQTKVIPARLMVTKQSGGKAQILYISHNDRYIKVIADRKLVVGSKINLDQKKYFFVSSQNGQFYFLKPSFSIKTTRKFFEQFGKVPLPPYIKKTTLTESKLRQQYQSVFAKNGLSVAAPTASLHFTKSLINKLKKQGIEVAFVTLNVSLGTFAPLREEQLQTGRLHKEFYQIDKKTADLLNKTKKLNKSIVAVGTTVVRTLESAAKGSSLTNLVGETDLFIRPGYKFKFVDSIITNFHVPKSSLLMLVSALTGRKQLLNLYQQAIKKRFRLFSFGDGMLII